MTVAIIPLAGSGDTGLEFTGALAQVLRARGHSVAVKPSMEDLRPLLGCEDYDTVCMEAAPVHLGVNAVIYGSARQTTQGYQVELLMAGLSTESAHVSMLIPAAQASGLAAIGTAARAAGILWPRRLATPSVAAARPIVLPSPFATPRSPPARRRSIPVWSKVGFALGATSTTAGTAMVVATSIRRPRLEDEVRLLAAKSLRDTDPANDVNLGASDLCADAATEIGGGGLVKNPTVASTCRTGVRTLQARYAGIGLMTIGFATELAVGIATIVWSRQGRARAGQRAKVSPAPGGASVRF